MTQVTKSSNSLPEVAAAVAAPVRAAEAGSGGPAAGMTWMEAAAGAGPVPAAGSGGRGAAAVGGGAAAAATRGKIQGYSMEIEGCALRPKR